MPFYEIKCVFDTIKSTLLPHFAVEEAEALRAIIFSKVLNISRFKVQTDPTTTIDSQQWTRVNKILQRLVRHEPIQYILGETEFFGLPFVVNRHVLIPRPETEELVAWVLHDCPANLPLHLLDIGTGSGCIAVAIAKNRPLARVVALDISPGAIRVAQQNAKLNNVCINWLCVDILSNLPNWSNLSQLFDVLVSNPPYVRLGEKARMLPNVLDYEPEAALFVPDNDPLMFYEAIAKMARYLLKPTGYLYFEINEAMGDAMRLMLQNIGYRDVVLKCDIFGKKRMIKCRNF